MKKLLIITGPTATGKTDLALKFARQLSGELISCDSRQVYKNLDIGTGKMPGSFARVKKGNGFWEINGIKVWMYDIVDPKLQYDVKQYLKDATIILNKIIDSEKLPIIVGGTGLYLKALEYGIPNLSIPIDENLRKQVSALSLQQLQEKLKDLSQKRWSNLNQSDCQNKRRLVRVIELELMYPYKNTILGRIKLQNNFDILKIGLTCPRTELGARIHKRMLSRLEQGMINEAKKVRKRGLTIKRMKELGLEYRLLAEYLEGNISGDQLITQLDIKIGQYAKRQITWFKKDKKINWFDISKNGWQNKVEKKVLDWYNGKDEQTS